jgi:hypothetical protein
MQSGKRLRGRFASGAVVDVVRTRQGSGWRYSIIGGELLVRDPDDQSGTVFRTIIHRRIVRLIPSSDDDEECIDEGPSAGARDPDPLRT